MLLYTYCHIKSGITEKKTSNLIITTSGMTWGTFHIMYDFSSKLGMHFEYLKCTITLFQKYALRSCVQYQSKMQGSDFLILGFFFSFFLQALNLPFQQSKVTTPQQMCKQIILHHFQSYDHTTSP